MEPIHSWFFPPSCPSCQDSHLRVSNSVLPERTECSQCKCTLRQKHQHQEHICKTQETRRLEGAIPAFPLMGITQLVSKQDLIYIIQKVWLKLIEAEVSELILCKNPKTWDTTTTKDQPLLNCTTHVSNNVITTITWIGSAHGLVDSQGFNMEEAIPPFMSLPLRFNYSAGWETLCFFSEYFIKIPG